MATRAQYQGSGKSRRKIGAWQAYARVTDLPLSSPRKTVREKQLDLFDDSCNAVLPPRERPRS